MVIFIVFSMFFQPFQDTCKTEMYKSVASSTVVLDHSFFIKMKVKDSAGCVKEILTENGLLFNFFIENKVGEFENYGGFVMDLLTKNAVLDYRTYRGLPSGLVLKKNEAVENNYKKGKTYFLSTYVDTNGLLKQEILQNGSWHIVIGKFWEFGIAFYQNEGTIRIGFNCLTKENIQ